jgi:predicted hydrolase (HD superfamily)
LKKLKDRSFAAGVDRDEVEVGAALLDVPLDEHVSFTIEALREMGETDKRAAVG